MFNEVNSLEVHLQVHFLKRLSLPAPYLDQLRLDTR